MAERRYVHGTDRFRETVFGSIIAFIGLQLLVAATFSSNTPTLSLAGAALIGIGVAVTVRGRRLGLVIADDRVLVRRFLFTLSFEKDKCRLVIDDDQPMWSLRKFALLKIADDQSQTIHQISWIGRWTNAPSLRELLNEIEATGLVVDRRPG
ncbi:MAG: hypothetical protein R2733_17370 [Acidimicrobiales bacterium]